MARKRCQSIEPLFTVLFSMGRSMKTLVYKTMLYAGRSFLIITFAIVPYSLALGQT